MRPHGDQLELRWKPSGRRTASEFVLEWTSGDQVDWQRESRGTTTSLIEGDVLLKLISLLTVILLLMKSFHNKAPTGFPVQKRDI